MEVSIKRIFFLVNILASTYIASLLVYSCITIKGEYTDLVMINQAIEFKYTNLIIKYKKVMRLILKNGLPGNMVFFNSIGKVVYNLPSIEDYKIGAPLNIITSTKSNRLADDGPLINVVECYENVCSKIVVNKEEVFKRITKNKFWGNSRVKMFPIKKATLVFLAINTYIKKHENIILFSLMLLLILYIFQTWSLFIRNIRLDKKHINLTIRANKCEMSANKKEQENDKLQESIFFIKGLISEYFAHYVHILLTRELIIEEGDLKDIFKKAEKFFNYDILKKDIKLFLNKKNSRRIIHTDHEMLLVIILNLVYRSIFRAQKSSKIIISVFQIQGLTKIKIIDDGFMYKSNSDNIIYIHELPGFVLEKLYQKLGMDVSVCEGKGKMKNVTSIKLKPNIPLSINNNVINFKFCDNNQ